MYVCIVDKKIRSTGRNQESALNEFVTFCLHARATNL